MTALNFLDCFCGAGGATHGIISAGSSVAAAINHDHAAITAHANNHPGILHLNDDIRKVNPRDLLGCGINAIWVSAECTHFSGAKGGQSRDADSRMLAHEAIRFAKVLDPLYIFVENVREFLTWGPLRQKLDTHGKPKFDSTGNPIMEPDPAFKGRDYFRWVRLLQEMGYTYDYRILNAADYGARQQRKRYFGIFAKQGLPIAWPRQTHHKNPPPLSDLKKWEPVRDILDLDNRGKSLLSERDPLKSDATIRRIEAGLNRYGPEFIQNYYSSGGNVEQNVASMDAPLGAVTTKDRASIITSMLVEHKGTGGANCAMRVKKLDEPSLTVTTGHHPSLVSCQLVDGFNHDSPQKPIGSVLPTVLAGREPYLFTTELIERYNTGARMVCSDEPLPTVLASKDQYVVMPYITNSYSGGGQTSSTEQPLPAITTIPKSNVVTVNAKSGTYIFRRYNGQDIPCDCRVVNGYLISNNIYDVRMRPLTVAELAKAQGFPDSYIFHPTNQQKSKKFIGNAVHTLMAELLVGTITSAMAREAMIA